MRHYTSYNIQLYQHSIEWTQKNQIYIEKSETKLNIILAVV